MSEFFDPTDAAFIDDPYPTLNELREAGPLHWDSDWGLWLVTRHADVQAIQRDRRFGRVRHGHAEPSDFRPIRELDLDDREAYYATERHSLLMLEPPEHTRLRGLVSRAFTPKRVRDLRVPITGTADSLLDGLAGRPGFDLLSDYAQPYSIAVIATLLGAPTDESDLLLDWSHAIVKMYELTTTLAQAEAAIDASRRFSDWTIQLINTRRERPQEDLITALCFAETEDGVLSDAEIVSTVILLLNAGHEATVNTIGNGMVAALSDGRSWNRVASGEVSATTAIEEMLRFDPPLQMFERHALSDGVEIAGIPIPEGSKVALLFGAANRDPRQYNDPDRFVVDRGDSRHITFGAGLHYCLGAPLARLELEIAIDRLAAAFPEVTLASEPVRENAFVIRGYEEVQLAT